MAAIDNIRRDLREASYLKYSPVPFAGAVHDFAKPLAKRLASREYTGPYYWTPSKPGTGRGFYQSSRGLACGDSTFSLRLELANDHITGRVANTTAYWCDEDGSTTLTPIIARLPHGRGFLAGWTMGKGMAACVDADIHANPSDAAYAAHDMAECDAGKERDRDQEDDEQDDKADTDSRFETVTGTAPSFWASYFINGDSSGMEDEEIAQADKFAEWLGGDIVDCVDADFMHHHDASQFGVGGADCQTYTALKQK
jgi:hypothetical protein